MNWLKFCVNCCYGAVGLAGVALGLLYVLQEKLANHPAFGLAYEDLWLTAADGTRLHAWYMWPKGWTPEQRRARPTVLFFQENAGNMAFRLPYIKPFVRQADCSLMILGYRGYGESEGSPSERGIQLDAQAALDHLLGRSDVDPTNIVLLGKSLGGAVAFYIAKNNKDKVRGIIIENTFTSMVDTIGVVMPLLAPLVGKGRRFNFLVRNKWPSAEYILSLRDMPILFLCSGQDEMLGAHQMRDLYALRGSGGEGGATPWTWVEFPEARHMDAHEVAPAHYWPAIADFLQRLPPPPAVRQEGQCVLNSGSR
ncbi:hypothetical protein N2152v2_004814 [Parachlorella kessleri]